MGRIRRFLAAGFTVALVSAGAIVMAAPVAQAGLPPVVDASITDGDPNSLRDVLQNQVVSGDTVVLEAGATYTLDYCKDGQIVIRDSVTIQGNGATIEQTCPDRVLDVKYPVTIVDTTITGGRRDGDGGGVYVDADSDTGNLVLQSSTVTGNAAFGDGGGIAGDGPITIVDSTVSGNSTDGDGGGLATSNELQVIRSTITGNCSEDDGGALDSLGTVLIVNSTVTGNTSDDQGAIAIDDGELTLVYSTVAANTLEDGVDCGIVGGGEADVEGDVDTADTEEPSNIGIGTGGMRVFGSVIALPIDVNEGSPGAFNCGRGGVDVPGPVTSSGYNYSDDDSCDLTAATDEQDAADPLLGPLAANGGPTLTRLPQTGSPLIDAIPTAACSGGNTLADDTITTDQRSLVRPDVVNQRCDIGAVEVQTEPLVIQPTFTG